MKIRNGFITNSSSSSYICELCGRSESGWDLCLSEAEMFECENGHSMCLEHLNKNWEKLLIEKIKNESEEELDEDSLEEMVSESLYELSEEFCPICNLDIITAETYFMYLSKKLDIKADELKAEIKENFQTLKELHKYCEVSKIES